MTSAFLLPPWAGFDEPFHHGYVEANAERLQWPAFREIGLPLRLVEAIRRWPLPPSYAPGFSAREYGQGTAPPIRPFRETNHETQQSPMYYAGAGLLLRVLPHGDPLFELYVLRLLNAGLAFLSGLLIWTTGRQAGLGWVPVALLALIPGFGIAMCRVANDALCATLIAAAVAGSLSRGPGNFQATVGALAAGAAPWAKLYGLAVLPSSAAREMSRSDASLRSRSVRVFLVIAPAVVLIYFSTKYLGHPFPAMYNVRNAHPASFSAVPWLRDIWTVAKSHIWISGMSFVVFPTWIYVLPTLLLASGFFLTISRITRSNRRDLAKLAAPVALFALALAYHDWRAFSFYGGGGGTGGWYLWAVALPEMLLLTYGPLQRQMIREWVLPVLAVFLILTVLADFVLFVDSTGLLVRTARGHAIGVAPATLDRVASAYLQSRPPAVGFAAVLSAVGSWLAAAIILATGCTARRNRRPGTAEEGGP